MLCFLWDMSSSEGGCRYQCERVGKYEPEEKAVRTGRDLHNMLVSSLVPQDWKLLEC